MSAICQQKLHWNPFPITEQANKVRCKCIHPQPASGIASRQLDAWRISWLIVFLRTIAINKREGINQSETSYHKVNADAATPVLVHTGCALAEKEMDWSLMLFENPPFEVRLLSTLLGTSRSLNVQTANAINLLLTSAVRTHKSTCRHQRDGEKRGERVRGER